MVGGSRRFPDCPESWRTVLRVEARKHVVTLALHVLADELEAASRVDLARVRFTEAA
jgi:hypothetical protein